MDSSADRPLEPRDGPDVTPWSDPAAEDAPKKKRPTRIAVGPLSVELPDADEEETSRDGFLSSAVEVHAAVFGAILGWAWLYEPAVGTLIFALVLFAFTGEIVAGAANVPEYIRSNIRDEVHYFVGGVVAGYNAGTALDYAGGFLASGVL